MLEILESKCFPILEVEIYLRISDCDDEQEEAAGGGGGGDDDHTHIHTTVFCSEL